MKLAFIVALLLATSPVARPNRDNHVCRDQQRQ